MLEIDRKRVEQTFTDYTKKYDASDEKIKLKIGHTFRVARLCERIARDLKLSRAEIEFAWLIGMLHDVGRFEQVKRYGTFIDSQSVDHAAFGADLLFEERLIECYLPGADDKKELDLLELAIRNHNVYHLPKRLSERESLFCNLIRDADKIDILKVNVDTPMELIYDVTTEELKNSVVTEQVLQSFEREETILKSIRKNAVDSLVGHISLTFELVFPISLSIVAEQGYLEKMLNFQSDHEKTRQQFQFIKEKMHLYLNKNLGAS